MNKTEVVEQNTVSQKISDIFITVINLFYGKYLFLTTLINIAIVSKPVLSAISITTGMYMYYTAETDVVGFRPCRLFGVLSCIYPDKYLFMTVFKILYFIVLLFLSFVVYLFIKRMPEFHHRLVAMFAIDVPLALLLNYADRQAMSLTLMLAIAVAGLSLYFLMYCERRLGYISPVLAALSVIIDARAVYLCLIFSIIIIVKKVSSQNKITLIVLITLISTLLSFSVLTVLSMDNKDAEVIREYFESRYGESYSAPDEYTDEETGEFHMSNGNSTLLPEGFFNVNCLQLITEWIPGSADTILSFAYEDIFQGLCYLYISLILVYNHLTEIHKDKCKSL